MRQQNTDDAWYRMMLQANVTLLRTDVTLFPIHTCTRQCHIVVLHCMSVLYRPLKMELLLPVLLKLEHCTVIHYFTALAHTAMTSIQK